MALYGTEKKLRCLLQWQENQPECTWEEWLMRMFYTSMGNRWGEQDLYTLKDDILFRQIFESREKICLFRG